MKPIEQLRRLARMQDVTTERLEAQAVVDGAPGRIEEIESHFRERNAEYVAVKDRHDEVEKDQRERNAELATLEESRKKFMADLMQVQNQREYAAILKEIDEVKAKISDHEDAVLRNMDELETLTADLEKHTEHIKTEREAVERERHEVESQVVAARETIARCTEERSGIESELPAVLIDAVQRVEGMRSGRFLVEAKEGICTACYVRVRPQAFQEIKLGTAIHGCGNCRRLLYFPSTVAPAAPPASEGDASATEMGAIDGGTV